MPSGRATVAAILRRPIALAPKSNFVTFALQPIGQESRPAGVAGTQVIKGLFANLLEQAELNQLAGQRVTYFWLTPGAERSGACKAAPLGNAAISQRIASQPDQLWPAQPRRPC